MTPALTLPANADRFVAFAGRVDPLAIPLEDWRRLFAESEHRVSQLESLHQEACEAADSGMDVEGGVRKMWDIVCRLVAYTVDEKAIERQLPRGHVRQEITSHNLRRAERLIELLRTMAVVWEELDLETPDDIHDVVWTVRISPLAYLRAMWNLFWSSIRHPLSETVIELKTGRILRTQ